MKSQKNETPNIFNKENKNLNIIEESSQAFTGKKKIPLHKSEKNLLINHLTLEPPDEKIHGKIINEEKKNSGSIHIRKSAQIENLKNIALQKEFLPIIKKLMLDGNIIDHNILKEIKKDIQKEETKAEINETNENIKDDKDKAIIKINGRKEEIKLNINREKRSNATAKEIMNDKYLTPKKGKSNSIYSERGKKIIKIVRVEKKNKVDKIPKHHHQEKKDRNEEIHMSDFKAQNDDKMDIIGEEEEDVEDKKQKINEDNKEIEEKNDNNNSKNVNDENNNKNEDKNNIKDENNQNENNTNDEKINNNKDNNIINDENNKKEDTSNVNEENDKNEDNNNNKDDENKNQDNNNINVNDENKKEDKDNNIDDENNNKNKNNSKVENNNNNDDKINEKKEDINNENKSNKNEAIDEFLKDLENKKEDENINNEKNKPKEEESEDPFEKAENEYRIQLNDYKDEEDEIVVINLDEQNNDNNKNKKEEEGIKEENESKETEQKESNDKEEKENENIEHKEEEKIQMNKVEKKEEIKNNDDNQNKDKDKNRERNYFKTYLNSLNKKPKNFNPLLNNPGDIYLKEVHQYQTYREKMKKYNKKTGKFDIFINKTNSNSNKLSIHNCSKENVNNYTLEEYKKSPRDKYTKKLKDNNFSPKSFSNILFNNTIYTTSSSQKRRNFLKKNYNNLNKDARIRTDSNLNLKNTHDVIKFILDKENDSMNKKLNPLNTRRNLTQKNQIKYVMNDPYNPYSTIWPNKFLNINYNMTLHYTNIEQGVPHLRVKKLKKKNLPPLYINNALHYDDKFYCSTFSSRFKKFMNLHSNGNNDSINNNKKNNNNEGSDRQQTELPKMNVNNKNNKNFSEIIE